MATRIKQMALLLVMVIAVSVGLSACSGGDLKIMQRASDDITKYGEKAVSAIDEYLKFEKTQDECFTVVTDIYERMGKLGIDNDDSSYNESDKIVYRKIGLIKKYGDSYSDADITICRDIIAFSIGLKPLKTTHTPDLRIHDDNRDFVELLGLDGMPTELAFEFDGSGFIYLDAMYGAKLSDLYDTVSKFCEIYSRNGGKSLHVSYGQYECNVMQVDIFDCSSVSGTVSTKGYILPFEGMEEMKQSIKDVIRKID